MKLLNIPMLNAEIVTGVSLMFFFFRFCIDLARFYDALIAHIVF